MSKRKVAEIFETMAYGPAPEDSSSVEAWLESHGRTTGLFINNQFENPDGRKTYESKNPATGKALAKTVECTTEDVDKAVASARTAFESFSKTPGHVRARYLYAIARCLQKHHRLVAVLEAMDNGKSVRETRDADVNLVIRHFYHHAGWAQLADTEMAGYQPIGVIGQVIPWNFPLLMLAWKIAPALAMGNCVVLKPATYTRLSAILFAQIVAEAGVPPGVISILTGSGRMGGYLCNHPGVDKVAFTGSTGVGQLLRRETAGRGIKISLELGGKSPIIVFNTADVRTRAAARKKRRQGWAREGGGGERRQDAGTNPPYRRPTAVLSPPCREWSDRPSPCAPSPCARAARLDGGLDRECHLVQPGPGVLRGLAAPCARRRPGRAHREAQAQALRPARRCVRPRPIRSPARRHSLYRGPLRPNPRHRSPGPLHRDPASRLRGRYDIRA